MAKFRTTARVTAIAGLITASLLVTPAIGSAQESSPAPVGPNPGDTLIRDVVKSMYGLIPAGALPPAPPAIIPPTSTNDSAPSPSDAPDKK